MNQKKKRGLEYWIPAILMLAMVVVVMIEVVTRLLGDPIIWGEEVAIWIMIWIIFFGLSYAFKDGGLVAVDFFVSKMKPRTQKVANVVAMVLTAVYFGLLLASAIGYFLYLEKKDAIYPMTGVSSNITTVAVIIGCVFAVVFAVRQMVVFIKTPANNEAASNVANKTEDGGAES